MMILEANHIIIESHYDIDMLQEMVRDYLRKPYLLPLHEIRQLQDLQDNLRELCNSEILPD